MMIPLNMIFDDFPYDTFRYCASISLGSTVRNNMKSPVFGIKEKSLQIHSVFQNGVKIINDPMIYNQLPILFADYTEKHNKPGKIYSTIIVFRRPLYPIYYSQ